MKINVIDKSWDEVAKIPEQPHLKPRKPAMPFRWLMKTLGAKNVKATGVTYNRHGMEKLADDEPCLILMNHSSFIDLEIAADLFYPRPYSIVCTSDGFVGKEWLMRSLGCIPTQKFVPDAMLVRDMCYAVKKLGCSILMYPEASYTFDGTATTLPDTLGRLVRMLKIPVVTVITHGAFLRDPLYNGLQLRDIKINVDVEYMLSPSEIAALDVNAINAMIRERFSFDNYAYQYEHKIRIDEPFRADGLSRVLYKCANCHTEGKMRGHGTLLTCDACGAEYTLTEYGRLSAVNCERVFEHIPDWYRWERDEIAKEIAEKSYRLDTEVEICVMCDFKAIYRVGNGRLIHDINGFRLTGCDGTLKYERGPLGCYGLYADYFWYELGDMICIGDNRRLYYCFPKNGADVVAKTRMATELIYELKKAESASEKSEAAQP